MKLFLDGGDPAETVSIIKTLGSLDGQTTNPTLISKNPQAAARLAKGEKFAKEEIYDFYRKVVTEISNLIPNGSVSIEVYADATTTTEQMITQAKEMFGWIPNAHIKFPTTKAGLAAAEVAVNDGLRVNMTLVFSQAQAAAVYAATKGAKKGDVFLSPFIGRLDDREENGIDLVANCMKMCEKGDGHVEVLSASVRHMDHLMACLQLQSDIITAPAKLYEEWAAEGSPKPDGNYKYPTQNLKSIPYEELDLSAPWTSFNIDHELTTKGIERFANDWNSLLL